MQKRSLATGDHEFSVVWSQDRSRFDILRDGKRTPSFSSQQGTAIGLALKEARREAAGSGKKIIVTSIRNGKRNTEWDGITPM